MAHADPFPTVPFEGVYLVTDELKLTTNAEVDALERAIGFRMPAGYREYVTTLGEGDYCDILRVHVPRRLLRRPHRGRDAAYRWMSRLPSRFTEDSAADLFEFADTSNADLYFIHPNEPDQVICLPEGGGPAIEVDARTIRLEDLYWHTIDTELEGRPELRIFESWVPFNFYKVGPLPLTIDELADVLNGAFAGSERHRDDLSSVDGRQATFYVKAIGGYLMVQTYRSEFIGSAKLIDRSADVQTLHPLWAALAECGLEQPKPDRIDSTRLLSES